MDLHAITCRRPNQKCRVLMFISTQIDEGALPAITELLHRNTDLSIVKLTDNRIACNEYEHYGLNLMKLLSSNTTVTVRFKSALIFNIQ